MKIFAIIDSNSTVTNGCFYTRTHIPLLELQRRGHKVEYGSLEIDNWDEIKDSDIVIFGRVYSRPFMGLLWRCKAAGIKVVYELDDDVWNVPETNQVHNKFKQSLTSQVDDTILESDMVTVSTEPLKRLVSRLHDNIKVIPNALDLEKWEKRPNREGLTIGWSGGSNHTEDLLLITDALHELQKKYDFKFAMQGFISRPIEADGYESNIMKGVGFVDELQGKQNDMKLELYEKILKLKGFYHMPFYPAEMYPKVLSKTDIDIGLVPVVGYKFDESKSILKLLEYTACGTTAICSDVLPYKGVAPYTAKNDKWYEAIEAMIKDEKLRKDTLKKQEKILSEYDIKKVGDIWEKEFTNLIK